MVQRMESNLPQNTKPPWIEYPANAENFPPTMVIRNLFLGECVVCGQDEGEHCDPVGYALCVRRANALYECLALPDELRGDL